MPLVPGIGWASKAVTVPCVFQTFERGVRCRADAQAGVTVRSSYEVRKRGDVAKGQDGGGEREHGGHVDKEGYVLVEFAEIECGPLVKAFVKRSFASAHTEILQRVIDELVSKGGGGAGGTGGPGPQKRAPPEVMPTTVPGHA